MKKDVPHMLERIPFRASVRKTAKGLVVPVESYTATREVNAPIQGDDHNTHHQGLKKMGMDDDMISIVDNLLKHSDNVFVVGGAVRDFLQGKKPKDFDIATDLKPEEIMKIFGDKAKLTGNVFPTVRVRKNDVEMEISTFRKEITVKKEGDRNAAIVEYAKTIEEDLARRDLTINAMAVNAKTGNLVDVYGGKKDLESKTIKFVGDANDRLKEDPLRLLRAIRFRLRLDGKYSPDTMTALSSNSNRNLFLTHVSKERIMEEMKAGAKAADKYSGFFTDLKEIGLLNDLFPELGKTVDFDGGPHHGEDIQTHSMLAGDGYKITNPSDEKDVMGKIASYFHDVGKPLAYNPDTRAFIGHDNLGSRVIEGILKRFRFSDANVSMSKMMVQKHMTKPTTLKGGRKLYSEIGDDFRYLSKLWMSDSLANLKKTGDQRLESVNKINESVGVIESASKQPEAYMKLAINGNSIMKEFNLKPGPHLKDMIDYAKEMTLEDPEHNNEKKLLSAIKEKFNL